MENAILVLILMLLGGIGLISIFTVINLVLPALVERTRGMLQVSLGRSLLLGLVNSVLAALLIGLLSLPAQQGGVVAGLFIFLIGLVGLVLAGLLLLGLTAAVSLLGARMAQIGDRDGFQPARRRPAGAGLPDALPGMVCIHTTGDDDGPWGRHQDPTQPHRESCLSGLIQPDSVMLS